MLQESVRRRVFVVVLVLTLAFLGLFTLATVEAFKAALKVPNHVETFSTQIHGWMAARGDLEDPEVRKEYERGYKTALEFLHQHA